MAQLVIDTCIFNCLYIYKYILKPSPSATMWCMEHEDDFLSETSDDMTTTNTDGVIMSEDSQGEDDEQHFSSNVRSIGTSVDPLESKKGVNYSSIIKQLTLEDLTRQLLEKREVNRYV